MYFKLSNSSLDGEGMAYTSLRGEIIDSLLNKTWKIPDRMEAILAHKRHHRLHSFVKHTCFDNRATLFALLPALLRLAPIGADNGDPGQPVRHLGEPNLPSGWRFGWKLDPTLAHTPTPPLARSLFCWSRAKQDEAKDRERESTEP
jgi:hypothetical protein